MSHLHVMVDVGHGHVPDDLGGVNSPLVVVVECVVAEQRYKRFGPKVLGKKAHDTNE